MLCWKDMWPSGAQTSVGQSSAALVVTATTRAAERGCFLSAFIRCRAGDSVWALLNYKAAVIEENMWEKTMLKSADISFWINMCQGRACLSELLLPLSEEQDLWTVPHLPTCLWSWRPRCHIHLLLMVFYTKMHWFNCPGHICPSRDWTFLCFFTTGIVEF